MSGSPGRETMTRVASGYAGSRWWNKKAAATAVLVIAALTLAACSSGTDSNLQSAPPKPKPSTPNIANPKLPAGTASTQQAVLNAWLPPAPTPPTPPDATPAPPPAGLGGGPRAAG